MHIESLPQLIAILTLAAASFGWGVTMNKKQDKSFCDENNTKLYKLFDDLRAEINALKVEVAKIVERLEALHDTRRSN